MFGKWFQGQVKKSGLSSREVGRFCGTQSPNITSQLKGRLIPSIMQLKKMEELFKLDDEERLKMYELAFNDNLTEKNAALLGKVRSLRAKINQNIDISADKDPALSDDTAMEALRTIHNLPEEKKAQAVQLFKKIANVDPEKIEGLLKFL